MRKIAVSLILFVLVLLCSLWSETVSAALLDVSVGTDAVVYKATDNVTISGYVRTLTTARSVASAVVEVSVDGTALNPVQTDSNGKYNFTPFTAATPGTHTVAVTASKAADRGYVYGSYIVEEYEKQYIIMTDKYTYSPGQNVSINFTVLYVLPNGSTTPAGGISFTYKIKTTNGTIAQAPTPLTTNSQGVATATYPIPANGYGNYMISVENGVAINSFEVPPFSITVAIQGENEENKFTFGTSESIVLKITATKRTNSNQTIMVPTADIIAYLSDTDGATKYTFTNFTESTDGGIYTSSAYALGNLTNGDYYIDVQVTKGGLTKSQRIWFKIESLKIDFVPFSEMKHVIGFLKGQNITLGMFIINMRTGEEISENQVLNATISGCRDSRWRDCLSSLPNRGSMEAGFFEFAKIFKFVAPNETGEFLIEIQVTVNTSAGETLVGTGDAYISVQNIITFAETKDQFDNWKFDFGPGERVRLEAFAYGGNWSEKVISSVQVVEIRNKEWNDITSDINTTITSNRVEFDTPTTPGFYHVKLLVTTQDGDTGYAAGAFQVRLYNIFVDTLDGPTDNANWKWKFGSTDSIYFRFNVLDMGGSRVSATNFKVELSALVNEMTQKRYTGLNVTELSADSIGRPGLMINLSNKNLPSGPYHAEFEITNTDGDTDHAGMWFKISNLNVWADVKSTQGEWKWRFGPTDNVTFTVNAYYFNGTAVPDGSTASVEELMTMREGPPIKVSSDVYNKSGQISISSGTGMLWVKSAQGKTLAQGHYMAIIKVTLPDGTTDILDAWFSVSMMEVDAQADPWSVSASDNVSIRVSVKKMDGTAVENATVELHKLRNAMTWTEVSLPSYSPVNTSSDGAATLSFPATGLNGQYEAELKVTSSSLGAKTKAHTWFEVKQYKISGWPVDGSRDTYQAGDTVEMWIKVEYPNSTWNNPQYIIGANVSVYKFANTEGWPWRYVTTVSMVQTGTTDAQGLCKIKFRAPSDVGRYNPMIQLDGGAYNSTSPWEVSSFNVRSASVTVTLYDNSTGAMMTTDKFSTGSNITVEINVSNPAGGEVNVSSIALKYKDMSTGIETTLQTLTYGLGSNNFASFTGPSAEGDYVLYVMVTDGSTGRTLPSEKRWFKIQSFDVRFWTTQWSYSAGQNATVNFDAITPTGIPANFTVELEEVRNAWTWSTVSLIYNDSAKNIAGSGTYIFTVPSDLGEYEAIFCVYGQGSQCSDGSQRIWMHFAVESFRLDAWPNKASYTSNENIVLNVQARYANDTRIDPSTYNATFTELRDMLTWSEKTSYITVPTAVDVAGDRKTFTFNASNLSVGDYVAKINVTKGSETRIRDVWFRISDAEITIRTVPQVDGRNRERWFTGEDITLNISISPAQDAEGKLKLMDEYGWREVASYDLNLTGGYTTITFSINDSSRYSAIARIGNSEAHYWFEAGAYQIIIKHWLSSHELRASENVSVVFDVQLPNGSQYSGDINISVLRLRNPWDWSIVSGTENLFSTTVVAGDGDESFNFSHGRTSGEFDCEMEFTIGDKVSHQGFWFMVRENIVDARPRSRTYAPGDTAYIDVWVAYPNMTAIEGANVTILSIKDRRDWSDVPVAYLKRSNLTDAYGNTFVAFTLPTDKTGTFEVKLNASKGGSSQVAHTEVSVSGYDAWFERSGDRWSYTPGDSLEGKVYVFDSSNNPVPNVSVSVQAKDEFWNDLTDVEQTGQTGADGSFDVSLVLDAGNFTPGHYSLYIDIGSGAATIRDIWFKVETFTTKVNVMKEDQSTGGLVHSDQLTTNDTIVIKIEVLDSLGSLVQTIVNSTLIEVRSPIFWDNVTVNFTQVADTTPPTNGITQIKLRAANPDTSGEFIVRINVTANISGVVSSNIVDAWFRISEYEVSLSFQCLPGSSTYCNPRRTAIGGTLYINVSIEGSYDSFQVCMSRIRNLGTGYETDYGSQYCTSNTSQLLTFPAPSSEGDYDAIFDVTVNGRMVGDVTEYFRVGGEYDMHSWVEPHNVYAGQNATMWIEVWGSGWEDIDESQCNISLIELRSARTWQLITTDLTYTNVGPMEEFGPPGTRLVFEVPSYLTPGDYMVKSQVICGGSTITGDGWFRVVVFQVASLLDFNLKSNSSAQMWIKVMNGSSGEPLVGATVRLDKLIDDWSWTTIQTYNWNTTTDGNGEAVIPFTAPSNPGHYLLKSTITHGTQFQEVDRMFDVRAMDIKMTIPQETFFIVNNQATVIINVDVTDPLNNSAPIPGANVELNLWSFIEPNGDGGGGQQSFSLQTNASGIARFNINSTVFNFSSGNYEAHVNVNTPERGWGGFAMKTIVVRKYNITVSGLNAEYNISDPISFNVTVKYANGTTLQNKLVVAMMKSMEFKVDGNQTALNITGDLTDANGTVTLSMTIPANASAGPTFMIIQIKEGAGLGTEDEEEFFFLIRGGGITLSYTNLNSSGVLPGQFIDVNVTCSNTDLALAPFMMHLEKTGGAVPMSQLMGGGPESGKETWYENSIFLDPNKPTHIKVLAQKQPGDYMILQPLIQKMAGFMGPENFVEVGLMEYTVL